MPHDAAFALAAILAVLIKEFKQLVRDRLTYAMISAIPVIQLLLFGYAINTDPRHLPTAVLVQDQGALRPLDPRRAEAQRLFRPRRHVSPLAGRDAMS